MNSVWGLGNVGVTNTGTNSTLGISKGVKRSKTPTITRTRPYGVEQKDYSPIRTSYGQYGRDVYNGRPPVGSTSTSNFQPTPIIITSQVGGSSIYRNEPSSILKSSIGLDMTDNIDKEASLAARLEVLEKENKNLQALVGKSEKQIEEATRKALEEENKIFTLFLGVINEKNIKIDLNEIQHGSSTLGGSLDASRNPQSGSENTTERELHKLLLDHVAVNAAERSNDIPYTLLALMRRQLVK